MSWIQNNLIITQCLPLALLFVFCMAFMYQTERNTRPTNRPFYNPIRWLLQRDISWNIYQDKGVFSSKQPESYKIFQNMWRVFAFQLFSILLPNVRCKDIAVFSLAGIDEGPDKSYLKWTQGPAGRQSFNALSLCMRWAGFVQGPVPSVKRTQKGQYCERKYFLCSKHESSTMSGSTRTW